MKILTTLAAGAVAASALFAVAPASAQHRVERERTVVRHDGPRMHHRQVCTTRYEHHRRVRVCR
ncbi:hypothetical protein [uncultured Sphingomonas sp.]|uniref:hypothetical protein n=1 Tax=uncultured Sphingomonas sp. TaxID=158754 RepID=UPI0035CA3D01